MQTYHACQTYSSVYLQNDATGELISSGVAVCIAKEVEARIDELTSALKSTAHVLSQMMLRNSAMDGLAKEALNEADKALALMET